MAKSPLMDSSFVVHVFSPGDDPIAFVNKAMAFLSAVASSRNNASGQARLVKCYNCQDLGVPDGQAVQTIIPNTDAFQTEDLNIYDSDLKCSTSNCGSKPLGNKKNDRISQTKSRNMKNKLEVQRRNVNKKNCVVEPIFNVDVKQSRLNTNSEL
nr:hypothetical protein [Tanacetum cinerariifolium]